MPSTRAYNPRSATNGRNLEAVHHGHARYTDVSQTHVAEVVAGESSLAELAIQLVQIPPVQLEHLTTVEAEVVRRRRDVILSCIIHNAGFREARQFL